jgi:photosystem II stability/assembly factor-like uncharacterized protein
VSLAAIACLAAVTARAAPAPAAEGFSDPLDGPALESALAARGPLNAVTGAGRRLVAVGQRGHVLYSDDGGASWTQSAVPVSTDLTSVCFPSPRRGWAAGHDGVVLATADGGRTWVKQLDGRRIGPLLARTYAARAGGEPPWLREQLAVLAAQGTGQAFLDVWFEDERTGFAVGAFNLVLRTEDGGESWTPWLHRSHNPRGLHLHAIRRVAGGVYAVGEQGLVLKLDPATQRLEPIAVGWGGSFFGVAGSGQAVVAFGLQGNVLRSVDGGTRWRKVATGLEVAITGAAEMPDGRLVLVSQVGHVLVSADGGASFALARGPSLSAAAAAAAGENALVIVGPRGVRLERLR